MYIHGNQGLYELPVIAILAAIALIFWIRQNWEARKRTSDLQALAPQLGFDSFRPERDHDFAASWSFIDRLSHGEDRYAFNLFEGDCQGQKCYAFDYHYTVGSGKNRQDYYFTMFMLVIKGTFPKVTIQPENLLTKIEGAFDSGNIKFESAEFSRLYFVHSDDKKFAYDVCHARMIEYLLANRGLEIEIQGPVMALIFTPELPVAQYQSNLQRLAQIRALLPQHLFEQNSK